MTEMSQAWWGKPVISTFKGQRQEDQEFQASLAYIVQDHPKLKVRPSFKRKKKARCGKAKEKQNPPSCLLLTFLQSSGEA